MTGADALCDTLLAAGTDVCFANPGTSEMHFVAALDRKPQMRCVLGLFEGVVTGAADGYARMAGKPAATLLHLGPGLGNGIANLHNARRARTPILNIVGDHASHHLSLDAPLTSDIEGLARTVSHWVGRVDGAADIRPRAEKALAAAVSRRGVATLILPADAAWGEVQPQRAEARVEPPAPPPPDPAAMTAAATALRGGRRVAIILAGRAMLEAPARTAGRIAATTGAALFSTSSARSAKGAGRAVVRPIPYDVDAAVQTLAPFEVAICIGALRPVAFFAYPGKPGTTLPAPCDVIQVAGHEHDLPAVLDELAEAAGVPRGANFARGVLNQAEITVPDGPLTADALSLAIARHLPEGAIVVDEALTSIGRYHALAPGLPPHDHLPLTGGAIGIGMPLATGAAIGAPGRKVVSLQADGSGMYTVQALWTQARERLDVVTIVFANRAYRILQHEMRNVGVTSFGTNASRMLDLDAPSLDWCHLAAGMGVEGVRTTTMPEFVAAYRAALRRPGPFLIEAEMAG